MQELTECFYTMQFTQCKTPQQNYTARQQLARNKQFTHVLQFDSNIRTCSTQSTVTYLI